MTNVLPPDSREAVRAMLVSRLVLTGSSMCTLAGIVAILALTPAFFSATIPLFSGATPVSDADKAQAAIYEEARLQASRARARTSTLAPFAEKISSVHAVIEKVYTFRPKEVSFLTVKYEAGEKGRIIITGTSSAREPVNNFRTALLNTGLFEEVSVPVAALVGALEGNFSMTLSGNF